MIRARVALVALALFAPAAQAQTLESRVRGLEVVALTDLPAAPRREKTMTDCTLYFANAPTTRAGRALAAAGWIVTAELPFGTMTAVSVMPGFAELCRQSSGSVAFFTDDRPDGLLRSNDPYRMRIGKIRPVGDGLRVHSIDDPYPFPIADLQLDPGGGFAALPLLAEQPVCNGVAQVPNIYNLPFAKARERILRAGWLPMPAPDLSGKESELNILEINDVNPASSGYVNDLSAIGISDPAICEHSDRQACAFRYFHPAGELDIVLFYGRLSPDIPLVVDYRVDCH